MPHISRQQSLRFAGTWRRSRRISVLLAGLVPTALMIAFVPSAAIAHGAARAGPAKAAPVNSSVIAAFERLQLFDLADVSDSDDCTFTDGPSTEFCDADVTWQGGTETVNRSYSGVIYAEVPITTRDGLRTPGKGVGKATEKKVMLSASATYSGAQDGVGDCTGVTGTGTETFTSAAPGTLTVASLTAVRDAHGDITDFKALLEQYNIFGPDENVSVTDDVTAADESDCIGTFTTPGNELFGSGDIDLVHDALGLFTQVGVAQDVKVVHWTINPRWQSDGGGPIADKFIKGSASFMAPDSGKMNLNEQLEVYAGHIISCRSSIANTRATSHRRVSASATIKCVSSVPRLTLELKLFRGSKLVGSSKAAKAGRSLTATTSGACKSGSYYGVLIATVTFPRSYTAASTTATDRSGTVSIRC
jgi:hypothetical protein